jgi:DNA-binding HxlR family transcriptional regulator
VNEPLPLTVRRFIAEQIESVAQLETLLLLRVDSQKSWNAHELSRRLYISEKMCRSMLEDLERRKFVVRNQVDNSVRYECVSPQADSAVAILAELYAERRVAVISEIHSTPISKVQTFADAFRLRKDDKP